MKTDHFLFFYSTNMCTVSNVILSLLLFTCSQRNRCHPRAHGRAVHLMLHKQIIKHWVSTLLIWIQLKEQSSEIERSKCDNISAVCAAAFFLFTAGKPLDRKVHILALRHRKLKLFFIPVIVPARRLDHHGELTSLTF